jgi:hypothetical protein
MAEALPQLGRDKQQAPSPRLRAASPPASGMSPRPNLESKNCSRCPLPQRVTQTGLRRDRPPSRTTKLHLMQALALSARKLTQIYYARAESALRLSPSREACADEPAPRFIPLGSGINTKTPLLAWLRPVSFTHLGNTEEDRTGPHLLPLTSMVVERGIGTLDLRIISVYTASTSVRKTMGARQ